MHPLRSLRHQLGWLALASGFIALIMSAVVAFTLLQRREIKSSFEDRGDSLAGLVFQFDREFLRLRQAMLLALQQPGNLDRDTLSLRYDILSSRVELVKNSPIMAEIAAEPEYTYTLSAIAEFSRSMDTMLAAPRLDPVLINGLVRSMWDLEIPIQMLSHVATIRSARNMEAASLRLLNQNALILALAIFQLAFLGLATLSHLRRKRQQRREREVLKQTSERLQVNEEKLILAANVFKHARESIVVADAAGLILEINENFCKETCYTQADLLGVHVRQLLCRTPDGVDDVDSLLQSVDSQGHWSGERISQRKDASEYPAMVSVSAVHNAQGVLTSYALFFNDITSLKHKQKQLEYVAHYDLLTGLPNRSLLLDRLHKAIATCARSEQSLAVAFLDLDGFKVINDNYGHPVGDQLLIGLAARMQQALRAGDSIARFGGDEFVALITGLDAPEDCIPVLERLLEASSAVLPVGTHMLRVSASIGVTVYPNDNFDADQLVRHADQSMYVAKQSGKNQFAFFDADREKESKAQMATLPQIKTGLERSEFELHYQPKVNMKTGKTVGLEALIRWNHPTHGFLLPAAFLPLIEDRPVSLEISKWVIATAMRQMQAWLDQDLRLPVSVNVAAFHLQQEDFYTDLLKLSEAHPACHGMLSIEILETTALSDMDRVRKTMQQCHSIGVDFALDDFGTGYSSLTYLSDLPAQELKVDQSFVSQMTQDRNHLSIVEGVTSLARAFRRNVIAEGVETTAQGELLLQLGCELGQGYGIARPMAAADVPGWLATWTPPLSWGKQTYVPKEPSMLLDELIRSAPVGVAIIDPQGIFENVNANYCNIYGFEREELIGSSFSLLFPPEDRQRVLELNRKYVNDGGELKGSWVVVRKDGTRLAVSSESVRVPSIKDGAHRLVYVTRTDALDLPMERPNGSVKK